MRTFASEIFEVVQGKQVFEKLLVDNVCLIDEFEQEINANPQYISELKTIYAYMNFLASGEPCPRPNSEKSKEIKLVKNDTSLKAKI